MGSRCMTMRAESLTTTRLMDEHELDFFGPEPAVIDVGTSCSQGIPVWDGRGNRVNGGGASQVLERPDRGYLFYCLRDRCLSRLGPGDRLVALIALPTLSRGTLICPARAAASTERGAPQEGRVQLEVALPSRPRQPVMDRAWRSR
jgi:hypothetical protein